MAWTTILVLFLGIAAYGVTDAAFLSKLADYVKGESDRLVIPQIDPTNPVKVDFIYGVLNIDEVDRKHNSIKTETFVHAQWETGITWTPTEYDGVDMITLPAKYFWFPQMQPLHTAVEVKGLAPELIVLQYNGTAAYRQVYKTPSLCDVSHIESGATCNSQNSLWGYSKDQVTVRSIRGDPSGSIPFFAGSKYEITGFALNFIDYPFDGKIYQIINTTVTIKQKAQYAHHVPYQLSFHWD